MKTCITIILLLFCLNVVAQKFKKLDINNSNVTLLDCNSHYFLVNVCLEPDSYLPSMMDSELCLLDSNLMRVKTYSNVFGYDNGSFVDENQYFIIKNDNLYKYNIKDSSHEKLGRFTYVIKKDSLFYLIDDSKLNHHHISSYSNGKLSKVGDFKLNISSTKGEGNQTKVYFNGNYYVYSFAGRINVYRLENTELSLLRTLNGYFGIHTFFVSYDDSGFYYINNGRIKFYDFGANSTNNVLSKDFDVKLNFSSNIKLIASREVLLRYEEFHTCIYRKLANTAIIKLRKKSGYNLKIKE